MKKLLVLLMSFALCIGAFGMVGCNKDEDEKSAPTSTEDDWTKNY